MNDEILQKANNIRQEIAEMEHALSMIENNRAVEISFYVGSFGCSSARTSLLPDEEVAEIKADISERLRKHAQECLDSLRKDFNEL